MSCHKIDTPSEDPRKLDTPLEDPRELDTHQPKQSVEILSPWQTTSKSNMS
jgi:hypothetical protein